MENAKEVRGLPAMAGQRISVDCKDGYELVNLKNGYQVVHLFILLTSKNTWFCTDFYCNGSHSPGLASRSHVWTVAHGATELRVKSVHVR